VNGGDTEFPPFSHGIFDTPPTKQNAQGSRESWFNGRQYDSWAILGIGQPPPLGVPLYQDENWAENALATGYTKRSFPPSSLDRIRSARDRGLGPSRDSGEGQHRQNLIFLSIIITTLFFPPAGLLALYGRFDSTISWYTYGQLHRLNGEQRGILKQQLCVEAALLLVLAIPLAAYYSVHD
jgi:hypothetical protein